MPKNAHTFQDKDAGMLTRPEVSINAKARDMQDQGQGHRPKAKAKAKAKNVKLNFSSKCQN